MTHAKLIARLSNLEGPHGLTGKELYDICRYNLGSDEALGLSKVLKRALNGSIDAAVSLAERVLPGWDYGFEFFGEDGSLGKVWKHGYHDDTVKVGDASTPAIALIIAVLKAKEADHGE